jgi:hypothetical protein
LAKPNPEKLATQIKNMQQELGDLQKALAELVDALIEEEKPGPKKIKDLKNLKKQVLTTEPAPLKVKVIKNKEQKNKTPKTTKPENPKKKTTKKKATKKTTTKKA